MTNEHEEDINVITDIVEVKDGEVDKTDWKAIALAKDEEARKAFGMATRYKTKAGKVVEKPVDKPADQSQSNELDNGTIALLNVNGIKDTAELDLVKKIVKETGRPVSEVIGSKYFQAELKDLRESVAADGAASAKGGQRNGNAARDTVDYWIAKGELPPRDQEELRRKVVNARIKKEQSKNQFTDNPIGTS